MKFTAHELCVLQVDEMGTPSASTAIAIKILNTFNSFHTSESYIQYTTGLHYSPGGFYYEYRLALEGKAVTLNKLLTKWSTLPPLSILMCLFRLYVTEAKGLEEPPLAKYIRQGFIALLNIPSETANISIKFLAEKHRTLEFTCEQLQMKVVSAWLQRLRTPEARRAALVTYSEMRREHTQEVRELKQLIHKPRPRLKEQGSCNAVHKPEEPLAHKTTSGRSIRHS
jgi:hypothetical protein